MLITTSSFFEVVDLARKYKVDANMAMKIASIFIFIDWSINEVLETNPKHQFNELLGTLLNRSILSHCQFKNRWVLVSTSIIVINDGSNASAENNITPHISFGFRHYISPCICKT